MRIIFFPLIVAAYIIFMIFMFKNAQLKDKLYKVLEDNDARIRKLKGIL